MINQHDPERDYLIRRDFAGGFEIEHNGLEYADFGMMFSMQCNHLPDTPEYDEILFYCTQIINHIHKIEEINK